MWQIEERNLQAVPNGVNNFSIDFFTFMLICLFLLFECYPFRQGNMKNKRKLQINLLTPLLF